MIRLVSLALMLLLFGCHRPAEKRPSPPASRIATVPVRLATGERTRTLLGQVTFDPAFYAQVMARVPALSVRKIRAFAGDQVRKGDPVLVLKSPDFLSAESELASVLNTPGRPGRIGDIRRLAEQKLRLLGASNEEIARLERTRVPVDRYEVRSPLSGTILRIGPSEGSQVKTGDLLFEVSDLTHLWVQAFLYPGEEAGIRQGSPVDVVPLNERSVRGPGVVSRIAPFIDPRTRTIPLRISLPNHEGLFRPDSWVRVRIPIARNLHRPSFLVPRISVVRMKSRQTAVFVLSQTGSPVPVPVTVLGIRGEEVEVDGTLSEGEKVVTGGLLPLLSGPLR
jgi:Cu(I)/Ag(I) efflux system membrane fusion protein